MRRSTFPLSLEKPDSSLTQLNLCRPSVLSDASGNCDDRGGNYAGTSDRGPSHGFTSNVQIDLASQGSLFAGSHQTLSPEEESARVKELKNMNWDFEHEHGQCGNKSERNDGRNVKQRDRRPLESAPISKRKAQTRAAQRTFRERKQNHLQNLEFEAKALENSLHTAEEENLLLRTEFRRMQIELGECRRLLSWSACDTGVATTRLYETIQPNLLSKTV